MALARVRRATCEARSAARKASPMTYTPPWKYRTTWRGSTPSTVISPTGTPPSTARVTVTSAGSGCADNSSRSSRRCSLTSLPAGKADCRRIASRVSRCSVLTEDLPSVGLVWQRSRLARPCQSAAEISCREAGHYQACRQAGEEASPDHGDSRNRSTAEPIDHGQAGQRPCRDVTVKHIEFQDTSVVVGNCVAEEDRAHPAAGRVEQIRPVALNVPVLQQVQADAVPVEAQAGFEIADHHHGMMNASGHSTRG